MALACGPLQSCIAFAGSGIDVGPVRQQQRHNIRKALVSRAMQCGPAIVARRTDVCVVSQQQCDYICVTLICSTLQRCPTVVVPEIDTAFLSRSRFTIFLLPLSAPEFKRRLASL